tara:strand:+ start:669 stop:1073 length:405 start_codon:yes stop_codon:yes gene_type:complete
MAGEGVCYVCWEPCSTQSQCRCASHVHPRCLIQTAIACETDCCTICKGPLPNLGPLLIRKLRETPVHPQAGELILICICSLFFSTLSLLFMAASTEQLEHYACVYAMCCFASLTLAAVAARILAHRDRMPPIHP